MSAHKQLLMEAFSCSRCSPSYGFTRPGDAQPYFKFPPTIGATGKADLLFVGMNPRLSHGNKPLFAEIMADEKAFEDLAENQVGGESYISNYGKESHYHHHASIVEALFGLGAKFEEHAAVTELFLCATPDAGHLPKGDHPCADLFLTAPS